MLKTWHCRLFILHKYVKILVLLLILWCGLFIFDLLIVLIKGKCFVNLQKERTLFALYFVPVPSIVVHNGSTNNSPAMERSARTQRTLSKQVIIFLNHKISSYADLVISVYYYCIIINYNDISACTFCTPTSTLFA